MMIGYEKMHNHIYIELKEMITRNDLDSITPALKKMVDNGEEVNLLVVLDEVKGFAFDAFLSDIAFYAEHGRKFNCVALVGDSNVEQTVMAVLMRVFAHGKSKYFDQKDTGLAKDWIDACSK